MSFSFGNARLTPQNGREGVAPELTAHVPLHAAGGLIMPLSERQTLQQAIRSTASSVPSCDGVEALIIWINALGISQRALAEASSIKRTRLQRILQAEAARRTPATFQEIEILKRALGLDDYDIAISQELARTADNDSDIEQEMKIIVKIMRGLPTRILQAIRLIPDLSYDEVTEAQTRVVQEILANKVEKSFSSYSRLCARHNEERLYGIAAE